MVGLHVIREGLMLWKGSYHDIMSLFVQRCGHVITQVSIIF